MQKKNLCKKKYKAWVCSDIHENFDFPIFQPNPEADLIIIAGDITNFGVKGFTDSIKKKQSMLKAADWFTKCTAIAPTFYIPGNHDRGFDDRQMFSRAINLYNKKCYFKDYSIGGASLSPCYNYPALATRWDYMTANSEAERLYYMRLLNPDIDILVSHSPPSGYLGMEKEIGDVGSEYLREYIQKYQPYYVFCGHIHNSLEKFETIGRTKVYNVATSSIFLELEF